MLLITHLFHTNRFRTTNMITQEVLLIVIYIVISISILGSMFIISVYLLIKEVRSFYMRMITVMVLTELLNLIGFLIPDDPWGLCILQASLQQLMGLASNFMSSLIAWALFQHIVNYDKSITQFAGGSSGTVLLRGHIEPYPDVSYNQFSK